MNILATDNQIPNSQAESLYKAQLHIERRFKVNVGLSWLVLFIVVVFLFSGQSIAIGPLSFHGFRVDTVFINENIAFISKGLQQTIKISVLSIMLAMVLALFAALGRLSKFPPFYAFSTFYVSVIRGTPLYLQIFFFFLALPQLGIILSSVPLGRVNERRPLHWG